MPLSKDFTLTVAAQCGATNKNPTPKQFRNIISAVLSENADMHEGWSRSEFNWTQTLTRLVGQFVAIPKGGAEMITPDGEVNIKLLSEDTIPKNMCRAKQ